MAYKIVRHYFAHPGGIRRRVIERGLTLEAAQKHCQDPETSSSTATKPAAVRRTRWFDGYEEAR